MDSQEKYKVIGLMSGTSLDGVDIVCCVIRKREGKWVYIVGNSQTVRYSSAWKTKLTNAINLSGEDLLALDVEYGKYLGVLVQAFIIKNKIRGINFIASHGHTIFHQPDKDLTFQLGNGNALHAACSYPVIYDFRKLDVALQGQGAPLVPMGDKYLFDEYNVCLNLGGIANLSTDVKGRRIAFDICFANMGLNYLAAKANQAYDKNGSMAADGELNKSMLDDFGKVYHSFRKKRPSLGYEIFVKHIKPILDRDEILLQDRLATFTESIALEIGSALPDTKRSESVLCTGGGAFNSFLMYRLVEHCGDEFSVIIPDEQVVKFKEAIVFAFLGVLRVRNEVNCLKSVTGAKRDSSGGVMIGF